MADLEQSRAGFHGLLSNSDDESVKTIYENESNAIGTNEVNDFIDLVIQRVESYTDPEGGENLSAAITSSLNQCVLNGDGTLQDNLVQTIQAYRDIVMTFFDIRFITTIQDGDPRPSNHRTDQMMRRSAPAINVDGDIAEHSEMDMENTRLYSNPTRVDQAVATVFNAEMRRHPFSPVKTPYADRIDVIHITHGLPVTQLVGIEELRNQYFHPDFDPRLLHLDPRWYFDTNNLTAGEQRLIRERNLTRHTAWAPSPWQTTTTPATPATPDRMPPRNPNSGI
jgi:hypothetical protein